MKKRVWIIAVVALAIVCAVFFGLNKGHIDIPKKGNVVAMSIDSPEIRSGWICNHCVIEDFRDVDEEYDAFLDKIKVTDFESIYQLALETEKALKEEGQDPAEEADDAEEAVADDDNDGEDGKTKTRVVFYLKDGSKVNKDYNIARARVFECVSAQMDDMDYRKKILGLDLLDQAELGKVKMINIKRGEKDLDLKEAQIKKLYNTLEKDILSQPMSVFEKAKMVGQIQFTIGQEGEVFDGKIYPQYKNTIALLKKYGYKVQTKISPDDVKLMVVKESQDDGQPVVTKIKSEGHIKSYLKKVSLDKTSETEDDVIVKIVFKDKTKGKYYLVG